MKERFVIYGLSGICLEVFWTGFASLINGNLELIAQTNLWMFFIYGLAVFLEPIHFYISDWPIYLRGGVYTILIFATEYFTGWLLQSYIGACPWYYTDSLNINGLITLKYIPVWFCLGLIFERFHILISNLKHI